MENSTSEHQIRPDDNLLKKMYIFSVFFIPFYMSLTVPLGFLIAYLIPSINAVLGITVLTLALLFLVFYLTKLYYHTYSYEFTDDKVIVNVGLITQTKKIVPVRTITNIEVHRGPFDRYFGLTTLDVQTAGGVTTTGNPEEKLIGLDLETARKLKEEIEAKIGNLQRVGTGGLSLDPEVSESDFEVRILKELIAIRSLLEKSYSS